MEPIDFAALPGGELIRQGFKDLAARRESEAMLLVLIGGPRLCGFGLAVPQISGSPPEHRLYSLLASSNSDSAHSRYNALIRCLVSFERALECVA